MPDEITTQDNAGTEGEENTSAAEVTEETDDADPEGADALGDPGKKALEAMKAERKSLKEQLRQMKAELEAARKPAIEDEEGRINLDVVKAEAEKAAVARANERILKAEIKAAAAGKLADPSDALRYLDLSEFDVDDNGNVDSADVVDAVEELLRNKPYLAAATGKRFQGGADQGARPAGKAQLTQDDLKKMTPAEINKARSEGRLNKLLGIN